jgi:hypothetical protein
MQNLKGFHSEWNLVCPGGWDYQRITQIIGKATWQKLNTIGSFNLELDFDHPLFYPRRTAGPDGESITDLLEWTRANWKKLVLKPEKGYSGHGVRVGAVNDDLDKAVDLALTIGNCAFAALERYPRNHCI